MRLVVIVFLILIVGSLGSALLFLFRGQGSSEKMFKALALRVGLSITLFLLLMAGYASGILSGRL